MGIYTPSYTQRPAPSLVHHNDRLWRVGLLAGYNEIPALHDMRIYIVLFILAVVTLSRRKTAARNVLLAASWLMAVLGTAQIILTLASCGVSIQISQNNPDTSTGPNDEHRILALGSLYDALSIVWSINNWKVVCAPGILILATFGILGCFLPFAKNVEIPSTLKIGFSLIAATNVMLMVLTGKRISSPNVLRSRNKLAGRIWWIRREAFHVDLDQTVCSRYNTAVAIILESGALYCICIILLVVTALLHTVSGRITFYLLLGLTPYMTDIAPTLTIVRVGLGHNIQDTIEKLSTKPPNQSELLFRQVEDSLHRSPEALNIRPEVSVDKTFNSLKLNNIPFEKRQADWPTSSATISLKS
ncbi:hypothetical protein GGX14DRAFT_633045 [Mycena pura]|uniref:Uncharacterized protein n=1 Tax=Mycena pura TaxID=153505 RepID=A0AAD6YEI2_9AGAR|nr:hypothetical protein GGX14DRAFT_633045 [Mycena pura]